VRGVSGPRALRFAPAGALLAVALARPAPARAECDLDLVRLQAWRGSVAAGARCGSIVVATDAATAGSSQARIVVSATFPYRLTLVARRLTGDGDAAIELELQGGYFLWRDGAWSIYLDEGQFAAEGWHRLPGLDSRHPHRVVIERTTDEVAVTFDGVALGRWPLAEATGSGPSIVLTGRRGARARLLVRELTVTPLARRAEVTVGSR